MLPLPLIRTALCLGLLGSGTTFLSAQPCNPWKHAQQLDLKDHRCVGIAAGTDGELFLTDTESNMLLSLDPVTGRLDTLIDGLDRPMHLSSYQVAKKNPLLIAEFSADRIATFHPGNNSAETQSFDLDGPAGVDFHDGKLAIADFYNHRVLLVSDGGTKVIGKKGHKKGQFEYPTDVQFSRGLLWVADAYNHRVQVFSMKGKPLRVIGSDAKMNAATGLFVNAQGQILVTDFENSRLLIFAEGGDLLYELKEGLEKPTDVVQVGTRIFVVNNHGKSVTEYQQVRNPCE